MIVRRRTLLATGAMLATHRANAAESFRIVMLLLYGWDDACSGFRDALTQRGIAPRLQIRDAAGDISRIAGFVREINDSRPDLLYISGSAAAIAALGTIDASDTAPRVTTVPTIVNLVVDPVAAGLVRSLDEPGRDVTGIIHVAPIEAQLRNLVAYRDFTTLATIYHPDEPDASIAVDQLRGVLSADGLQVMAFPVSDGGASLPAMVDQAAQKGADWLYIPPDPRLEAERRSVTGAALAARLPSYAATEPFLLDAEALVGLVCHRQAAGAQAARLAGRILLDRQRASSLPFQRVDRFSVQVRMDAARTLHAYPPMMMLRYAEVR